MPWRVSLPRYFSGAISLRLQRAIAAAVGLSAGHLTRLFREAAGLTDRSH